MEVSTKMGILARCRRTVIHACRQRFTFDPPYELHTVDFPVSPKTRAVNSLVFVRRDDLPFLHHAGCDGSTPRVRTTSCEAAMRCEAQNAWILLVLGVAVVVQIGVVG